ncbi:tetratricopeptide repeat protein, partial [Streptomyces sp. NPDC059979]|uniref:tetratricopeptide repeat protein n=1 Tax=Streptomyces sp. NPDC059979 TaxID=3347021 RepID=UPI003694159D
TPNLSGALHGLGGRLVEVGQHRKALAASEEAVELLRQLEAASPDAHSRELAGALDGLGCALGAVGQRREALAATEEAVALYTRLHADLPKAYADALTACRLLHAHLSRTPKA